MDNIIIMQEINSLQDLHKILESLKLREDIFSILVIKQISFFCIFHYHINIFIFKQCLPQPNDVGMVHFAMKLDLSFN